MTTLKRSASFAFGEEGVAKEVESVQASQSAPTSPRKRSGSQKRSLSMSRRVIVPRSPTIQRQASLRRVSAETTVPMTYRMIKRQRTNPPESWENGEAWSVVGMPQPIAEEPAATSSPQPSQSAQNFIIAASYRIFSSLGFGRSTPPTTPTEGLPHLIEPQDSKASQQECIDSEKQDVEMEVICEEDFVLTEVEPEIVAPPLPPSPISAYTPLQWSLLSRHPHLVERVLSGRYHGTRKAHASFVAHKYIIEANPNCRIAKPRKTSPLSATPPITLPNRIITNSSRPMMTDRIVRAAQRPEAPRSRWANYPTCTQKYPGPDGSSSLHRNTVLLNFGDWLKSRNLWVTITSGSLELAKAWYEKWYDIEEGAITPTVSSPTGSIADLEEFAFKPSPWSSYWPTSPWPELQ